MNTSNVLRSLLVLTWILVDAAVIKRHLAQPTTWPNPTSACALGLMFGQVALLCAWMVWSRQRRIVRWAASIAGLCLAASVCARATDGWDHTSKWLTLFSVYVLMITAPLAAIRMSTASVENNLASVRHGENAWQKSWQFSLAGLFSSTTCIALLLGFLRWLDVPARHPASFLSFCLATAVLSLALLSVAWSRRPAILGCLALGVLCPLAGWLLPLTGLPPAGSDTLTLMIGVHGFVIASSVVVMRVAKGNDEVFPRRLPTLCGS